MQNDLSLSVGFFCGFVFLSSILVGLFSLVETPAHTGRIDGETGGKRSVEAQKRAPLHENTTEDTSPCRFWRGADQDRLGFRSAVRFVFSRRRLGRLGRVSVTVA